mmetsp:Transcript_35270/g.92427  ORF Transcript_35270/g.92427 Transcript_35270/m.92427 type:complete len:100 (+) Transcript_35270:124-423(+)
MLTAPVSRRARWLRSRPFVFCEALQGRQDKRGHSSGFTFFGGAWCVKRAGAALGEVSEADADLGMALPCGEAPSTWERSLKHRGAPDNRLERAVLERRR